MLRHVSVDGAEVPGADHGDGVDLVEIVTSGEGRNVNIQAESLGTLAMGDLPQAVEDLIVIATVVYAADARVRRLRASDIFATDWRRDFSFAVPVLQPDLWNDKDINDQLVKTLDFLTGDTFAFAFQSRQDRLSGQLQLPLGLPEKIEESDVTILFSGGLDSLAATAKAVELGRKPLLVGHRPATIIHSRQERALNALRPRLPAWPLPFVGLKITAMRGQRPVEFSQRSRAFLFAALGGAACQLADIDELWLCDNGVVTLNLPQPAQNVGTLQSRSTHPRFLADIQTLLRMVLRRPALDVRNTLLEKTKTDVVQAISSIVGPEVVQETTTCAHPEGKTRQQPHCGVCTQCIDRRFATVAAGVEEHDLASRYVVDIFTSPLEAGDARTHAENYVRFVRELDALGDAEAFAGEYFSRLDDACVDEDPELFIKRMWPVFRRHRDSVFKALEKKFRDHSGDLIRGLPSDCLLRMVATGTHLQEPRERYARMLGELLNETLPVNFQSRIPSNENEMQAAGQAAFIAAHERLKREAPQTPFGAVSVRSDFSDYSPKDGKVSLLVEFKLVKERKRLNKVQGEMAADLVQYPKAWILFVVFDVAGAIPDIVPFVKDFENQGDVVVQVVKR